MARTPTALLSPADRERRRGLRVMKSVALGALVALAVVFAITYPLQAEHEWAAYVRAAAEGGMVGALADWFAVTALFRRPLGLPIPHTAIIPTRKDEIGASLGEFVETNFLNGEVVRARLEATSVAARLGEWAGEPAHAERVVDEASRMLVGVLRAAGDDEMQDVLERLAREQLVEPEWGPALGAWLEQVLATGAHTGAVDLALDSVATWLDGNREAFAGLVSRRLPSWVPSLAHRFIDDTVYAEAVKFVAAVQGDPEHPARRAVDGYLARLADRLQHDPGMRVRLEGAKGAVFDSPRVRELASRAWGAAKAGLEAALADPGSGLRRRAVDAVAGLGVRLASDDALRARVDARIADAAGHLVERYRHDLASIITDTVARWDAAETTEKIELFVGRDLQYIRLNGTVVGALAGAAIFALAQLLPVAS